MTPNQLLDEVRHRTMDVLLAEPTLSWNAAERRAVRELAPALKEQLAKAKRSAHARGSMTDGSKQSKSPLNDLKAMLDKINTKPLKAIPRYRINPALMAQQSSHSTLAVYDGGQRKRSRSGPQRYVAYKTDDGRTCLQRLFSEYD